MEHKDAVRLKAPERYLLNELDPDQLDQFEEHLFDCQDCALDVRAGAMFIEQSKNVLTGSVQTVPVAEVRPSAAGWFAWLRPAFAVPAMAVLLAVVGYQNLVELPAIRTASAIPQIVPSVSLNVATRGTDAPVVTAGSKQDIVLNLDLPPNRGFSSYIADLYNSAGKIEWSLAVPADAVVNDSVSVRIPGSRLGPGTYAVAMRGVSGNGNQPVEIGRHPFELRLQ